MNTAGQNQDAGEIAAWLRQVHPGVERAALTLECETVRLRLAVAGFDFGRPFRGVDAAVAQDPAEVGRDLEIATPGVDHDRKLVRALPVEDCDQPLDGIPLDDGLRRDPVRAARPACVRRAVRDLEDHGIGQFADAADRWSRRRLRRRRP